MTTEDDAIRRLAAADPAGVPGSVSDPTSPAVRAILHEVKQMTIDTQSPTPPPSPSPSASPTWWQRPVIVAAAAVAVLVVGVGFVLTDDNDSSAPIATVPDDDIAAGGGIVDDGSGAAGSDVTACVEMYSPETLVNRDYAIDGTITAIDDATGEVTLAVNEWFSGGEGATTVLDGTLMNHGLLDPTTSFDPGTRVLLAGDDQAVWTCGFTQLHSPAAADEWRAAFG